MRRLPGVRALAGTLAAGLLAALYLWIDPQTADLAAQLFRTELYREHGFAIYNPQWYSGHHLPGYSLLSPVLMAVAGSQAAGAVAAVVATFSFERIAHRFKPDTLAAPIASCWFALGFAATCLFTGRITFALGVAFAVTAAAFAGSRTKQVRWLAPPVAAVAGLTSPVAGALLVIAMAVWATTAPHRRRISVVVMVSALLPAAALLVAFPAGGTFPFVLSSMLPTLAAITILWLALPVREVLLRRAVIALGLLVLVSGVLPTAMGGNATRPVTLLAGSIAALGLWPHNRTRLLLLAPILLYGQLYPALDDCLQSRNDPSTTAAYYAPLRATLAGISHGAPLRVEVPFTDNHWESFRLTSNAPNTLLARGWERQLDRKRNPLFYRDGLTHEQYADWLRESAVSYVALPDAPLDYSAAGEAELIRSEPGYLREIWHDDHWRLFQVTAPLPLVDGGRLSMAEPDRLTIEVSEPGQVLVRSTHSPYFELAGPHRLRPWKTGGWMMFCAPRPGTYTLRASIDARLHHGARASGAGCGLR